jgi:hypothetical protein
MSDSSLDDEYCWENYSDFKVLILNDTYINATKLCEGNGKSFTAWLEEKQSKDLISQFVKNEKDSVLINKMDMPDEIRGIYVHLDLIPSIISWISPSSALKINIIVNNHYLMDQ